MEISITKEELYLLIKSAVKEVIEESKIDYILENIPNVSDAEMNDIKAEYNKPYVEKEIIFSEQIDL